MFSTSNWWLFQQESLSGVCRSNNNCSTSCLPDRKKDKDEIVEAHLQPVILYDIYMNSHIQRKKKHLYYAYHCCICDLVVNAW